MLRKKNVGAGLAPARYNYRFQTSVVVCLVMYFSMVTIGCHAQVTKEMIKEEKTDLVEQADPYFWDFGKLEKNTVLTHEFVLKNEAETVLNIESVTVSCGCTVAEVKQKNLKAGESTMIKVKLDTKGYSGIINQFVYVNTDNPENAVVKFTVKAEIQ